MNSYILRVRPYNTMYDVENHITQLDYFAKVCAEFFKNLENVCVWSQMKLHDGTILIVFEQPANWWTTEWFHSQFEELFKYTDGYELEVCPDWR